MPLAKNSLFPKDSPAEKRRIYSVSQITRDIKTILEEGFSGVWVEGEISNFKQATSGHYYFSLKDTGAIIGAAMFYRANREVKFKLEDGLKVVCFGRIDVYAPKGNYQLVVEKIEPKGIGAQQLAFEQLKNRLLKEGLFDPAHKKELPLMPWRVGIVTSSAGAAVRDILQLLKKGAPCVDVVIRAAAVQGELASAQIAQAVEELNQFKEVDIIIISRGGGSTEDLWSFNEEAVARAIYNSKIPTLSAVGHQINITLSDMVADAFVETPSAAAKMIIEKKNGLLAELDGCRYELSSRIQEILSSLKNNLAALRSMLKSPLDRLQEKAQLMDEIFSGLNSNMRHFMNISSEKLSSLISRLEALSPLAILARGYSLTMIAPEGAIIREASAVRPKDKVKTVLAKGYIISSVEEVADDERKGKL